MKKITIATVILFAGFVFVSLNGCKTVEVATTTPTLSAQKQGPQLQPLTQKYVRDLSSRDSAIFFNEVWFYNRTPIDLSLFIYDKSKPFSVQEGVASKENTNTDLLKTVPEMTPGVIIPSLTRFDKTDPRIITGLVVNFDQSDKTYRFKFRRRSDGCFILIPDATIEYKGQPYKVSAQTPEGGTKECLLMFYGDEKKATVKVTETAKGVKGGGSIKGPDLNEPQVKPDEENW